MTNHELSDAICGKLSDDMRLGFKSENGIFNRLDEFICRLHVNEPETCVCAGVKCANGYVVRGHRHADCMVTLGRMFPNERMTQAMQGFITSRNRWVSREEGSRLQHAAGIVSHLTGGPVPSILFSEDLY